MTRAGLGDPAMARCERCGAASPLTSHHRIKRGHGGGWAPSNIVVLDGSGTTGCHGWTEHNPAAAEVEGWAVPSGGDPRTVPIFHKALGMRVLLDDEGMMTSVGS